MTALRPLTTALLLALLGGCASTLSPRAEVIPEGAGAPPAGELAADHDGVAVPAAAAVRGAGANDNLNAIAWMQTSVEFRLIAGQTFRGALVQLDKAIKTPGWDALAPTERDTPVAGLPPAVIVDVDETVLDNTPYGARNVRDGKGFDDASWNAWVQSRAARAVPGALEFARAANARGVAIYYISNRSAEQGPATIDNLRKAGFPVPDAGQFLGLGTLLEGCAPDRSEKGCRRRLVGRSHRVLMQFGDQVGDFVDIAANNPAGREQAVRPYLGWVGERWFVLPNPSYGSWEPALFDNAWSQPEAARRARKLDALRY
jgi:acid phosphatase